MSQNQSTTMSQIQFLLGIEEALRQKSHDLQRHRLELVARGIDQHINLSGTQLVFTTDETAMFHYELADIRRDGRSIMAEVEQALQVPAGRGSEDREEREELDGDTLGSFLLNQSGFHLNALLARSKDQPVGLSAIYLGRSSTGEPMQVLVRAESLLAGVASQKDRPEQHPAEKNGAQ